jgi:hypothetical protein
MLSGVTISLSGGIAHAQAEVPPNGVTSTVSGGSPAHAGTSGHSNCFTINDFVGTWAGVASGTFQNSPFASTYTLTIDATGNGTFTLDSTAQDVISDCNVAVQPSGFAVVSCTDRTGQTPGAKSSTHFVITDQGQRLTGWSSAPSFGFLITTTAYRQ